MKQHNFILSAAKNLLFLFFLFPMLAHAQLGAPSIAGGNGIGAAIISHDTSSLWQRIGSNVSPLSNSWNVGIGTTTPSEKLEVNGDAFIHHHFTVGVIDQGVQFLVYDTSWQCSLDGLQGFNVVDSTEGRVLSIADSTFTAKIDNFNVHSWFQITATDSTHLQVHSGIIGLNGHHYAEVHSDADLSTGIGIIKHLSDTVINNGISIFKSSAYFNNGTAAQGKILLFEDLDNGTNSLTIQSPASFATSRTITLPSDAPGAGKVVQTDGSGNWSYVTPSGSIFTEIDDSTIIWINNIGDTLIILNDPSNGLVFFNGLYKARFAMKDNQTFTFGNGLSMPPTLEAVGSYPINITRAAITTSASPASGAACTAGEITWDASYIYVCTASGAWKRSALTGGY